MTFNELINTNETPFDKATKIKCESPSEAVFNFFYVMCLHKQSFTNMNMAYTLAEMCPSWYSKKLKLASNSSSKAFNQMLAEVSRFRSPSTKTKLPHHAFKFLPTSQKTNKQYCVVFANGFNESVISVLDHLSTY